jgi:hypothetical protein
MTKTIIEYDDQVPADLPSWEVLGVMDVAGKTELIEVERVVRARIENAETGANSGKE